MADKFDFSEAFTKANANLDFTAAQFAKVLRDLMRAISSDDPGSNVYHAAQNMNFVADLLSKTEEKFGFYHLFAKAVEEFQDDTEWGTVEHATVRAAQRGVKFLVERSCSDNAARGRTSRREGEFVSAIKAIDDAREHQRRKLRGKP